jgi:hypothetical protein
MVVPSKTLDHSEGMIRHDLTISADPNLCLRGCRVEVLVAVCLDLNFRLLGSQSLDRNVFISLVDNHELWIDQKHGCCCLFEDLLTQLEVVIAILEDVERQLLDRKNAFLI